MNVGAVFGVVAGGAIAVFGFVAMRNPMRFARLAPGTEGYYQRLVLDKLSRVGLRVLAALVSLFGLVIFAAALGSLLKVRLLNSVSESFLALLWVLFIGLWVGGIVLAIVQVIQGTSVDWFQFWRRGVDLGPINVYPQVTPAMEKEARRFTLMFCAMVGVAICAAIYRG
jgi:hypothetical protein